MCSKRWILSFLATVLLVLGPVGAFNYWVDREGIWATETYRWRDLDEGISRQKKYGAWRRHGGEVLIMGSSRVAFLDWPKVIDGGQVQVIAYGEANLAEQALWWREILARGGVRKIFLGLDYTGMMRGWDKQPPRLAEAAADKLRSLFHYRHTLRSIELPARPPDWQDHVRGVFDLRTGHVLWHKMTSNPEKDLISLAFFRSLVAELPVIHASDAPTKARLELAAMLTQAEKAGVEVVVFINPVTNRYFSLFEEFEVWDEVMSWKQEMVARHGAIDLMQEWPEEMQDWFFDPAHLDFAHSRWMWAQLGIDERGSTNESE